MSNTVAACIQEFLMFVEAATMLVKQIPFHLVGLALPRYRQRQSFASTFRSLFLPPSKMAAVRSKAMDALRRLNSVASIPTTASYRSLYGAVASQSTFTGASNTSPTTPSAPQGAAFSTRAAKLATMDDADVVKGILSGEIKQHNLEKHLKDPTRAAIIRRKWTEAIISSTPLGPDAGAAVQSLPVESFNTDIFYKSIEGTNCENVIGYVWLAWFDCNAVLKRDLLFAATFLTPLA